MYILPILTEIPDTVTRIGPSAFYSRKNLKYVNIPTSVAEIGMQAFSHNEALTDIYYGGAKQQWVSINFGKD